MAKFQKKPIVIEAFKWTGGPDQEEDPIWIVDAIKRGDVTFRNTGTPDVLMDIKTLEGTMTANPGDMIIQGVKGEIYPCKLDIFEASYQAPDYKNHYDRRDMIRREGAILAAGLKIAAYRVRDPETDEFSNLQFHGTYGDTVLFVMGEGVAKLFMTFAQPYIEAKKIQDGSDK